MAQEHNIAHTLKKPYELSPLWTGKKTLNILLLNLRLQLPILPKEINMDTHGLTFLANKSNLTKSRPVNLALRYSRSSSPPPPEQCSNCSSNIGVSIILSNILKTCVIPFSNSREQSPQDSTWAHTLTVPGQLGTALTSAPLTTQWNCRASYSTTFWRWGLGWEWWVIVSKLVKLSTKLTQYSRFPMFFQFPKLSSIQCGMHISADTTYPQRTRAL